MEDKVTTSNRKLFIGLATGALLLAVVAVILVVTLVLGRDSEEGAALAESAKLMPKDTISYTTFNPHLDQAKNFEVLQKTWGDNPLVQKGLAQLTESMSAEGIDYKADIEPWLGDEVAFGISSNLLQSLADSIGTTFEGIEGALEGDVITPEEMGDMADVPEISIVAATKDKSASDRFLGKLRTQAEEQGAVWQATEYKGVQVSYAETDAKGNPGIAYATVGDHVALTLGGLNPMQALIDAQDGDNLSGNQGYQDVLAKLPADQIGYGYVDVKAYMNALLGAAESEMGLFGEGFLSAEQLEAIEGVGYSFGLESNGLRADFVAVYDKEALPEDMPGTQASPNKTVERVPGNTLFYMSSNGLGEFLRMGLDAIKAMPEQPEDIEEQLNMLTAMLGVSVDELIEMLSGEYALAVTHQPAGIGGDPSIPVGASVLIEAKEEERFQRLLRSVAGLLAFGGDMEFPQETISGVEVTTIPNPMGDGMIAGWGVGKGFFAIGTSARLLELAFGGGGDKLVDAATYKAVTALLPEKNTGVFYLNLGGIFQVLADTIGSEDRESFEEARSIMGPIKAIGAASEPIDTSKGSLSGTLFVLIESE